MRIVLAGLGHAHLQVMANAQNFRDAGVELHLVDEGAFWYSSIASGLLGGRYEAEDDRVDAAAFAAGCDVGFTKGRIQNIRRDSNEVLLADGRREPFDLISVNLGSVVAPPFPVADAARTITPKPIAGLLEARRQLVERFEAAEEVRVLTIGGGYSGCELTCNLAALAKRHGGRLSATLVTSEPHLIPGEPAGARSELKRVLTEQYGVSIRFDARVNAVHADHAELDDGSRIEFDRVLVATGLVANPASAVQGLDFDRVRGLTVRSTLAAPADDRIFAAGDCANIEGHHLPKVGVFGVRAAPVLSDNLLHRATGRPLRDYRPQSIWFASQNLGDGTGLATYGPFWWRGRSALTIKDRIDKRFMQRWHRLCTEPA